MVKFSRGDQTALLIERSAGGGLGPSPRQGDKYWGAQDGH